MPMIPGMGMDPAMGGAPPPPESGDPEEFARSILDLLNEWRNAEQDEEDLLLIEKISTDVQKLLARNAKEVDQMMSGKLAPKLLAQAYGQ